MWLQRSINIVLRGNDCVIFVAFATRVWQTPASFAILSHMNTHAKTIPSDTTSAQADTHPAPRKKHLLGKVLLALVVLYGLLNLGGKVRLVTRTYEIEDARISSEVRIAVVSDLHGARYGKNQSRILSALDQANPDAVLLLGDIFDEHNHNEESYVLLDELSGKFDCYFIFGNHEYKSGEIEQIRSALTQAGIPILSGTDTTLNVNGTRVQIFGIDDILGGSVKQQKQLASAAEKCSDDVFSILAIHAPNGVESYLSYGFDLMLSGHTHGGQIIIPSIMNGLYAPGQGLLPKYGGGRYDFDDQTLIISRGLARKPLWLPRVFNPPELVLVDLKPLATNP